MAFTKDSLQPLPAKEPKLPRPEKLYKGVVERTEQAAKRNPKLHQETSRRMVG